MAPSAKAEPRNVSPTQRRGTWAHCAVLMLACAWTLAASAPQPTVHHRWTHTFYYPASGGEVGSHKLPLVVFLHGCHQVAWHAEKTTRLYQWAEKYRFAVLMPEQNRLRNPWKCWNWFLGDDSPEMDEILDLVHRYQRDFDLQRLQTFVMGLSAGGVMTAHLLACHGKEFAGGAVFSGAAYRMLGLPDDPLDVPFGASPLSPMRLGVRAVDCMKAQRQPRPVSVLVVHGTADLVSFAANGTQVAEQFALANHMLMHGRANAQDALRSAQDFYVPRRNGQDSYTVRRYPVVDGARVERVMINSMGHGWGGGPWWLPFSEADAPDGTQMALRFFGLVP